MIRKYKNLIPKVPASCFIFPTAEIIGSVELARMSLSIPVRLCVQAMEKSPLATKQIYRKTSPSM